MLIGIIKAFLLAISALKVLKTENITKNLENQQFLNIKLSIFLAILGKNDQYILKLDISVDTKLFFVLTILTISNSMANQTLGPLEAFLESLEGLNVCIFYSRGIKYVLFRYKIMIFECINCIRSS